MSHASPEMTRSLNKLFGVVYATPCCSSLVRRRCSRRPGLLGSHPIFLV